MRSDNLHKLPNDLPTPVDDGAADHLKQALIPDLALESTHGDKVNLYNMSGPVVVFCYPRTGQPNNEALGGTSNWNAIPGARGCTPQACSYRDNYDNLKKYNFSVFGLCTQDSAYQKEAVRRLNLPYPLLSDNDLRFMEGLNLPHFEVENAVLLKRITLIIINGRIEHHFYPVFPPDEDVRNVLYWASHKT